MFSTNKWCSTTVFNVDNNKYFMSTKSAYYTDLWRSFDTEDWNNYILKYIKIENSKIIFQILLFLLYFFIK